MFSSFLLFKLFSILNVLHWKLRGRSIFETKLFHEHMVR